MASCRRTLYGVSFGGDLVASSAKEFRGVTRGGFVGAGAGAVAGAGACSGAGASPLSAVAGAFSLRAAIPLFRALFLFGGIVAGDLCQDELSLNDHKASSSRS